MGGISTSDTESKPKQGDRENGTYVPIQMVPLERIRPHWLNDRIYGPVDPKDPDVRALAQSIREFGLKEPLLLTCDFYLISVHRRRVACKIAGVKEVPCGVEDYDAFDPRVPEQIVVCNRQRVKTADAIQGVAGRLRGQPGGREAAQLVVDQRQKRGRRLGIALVHRVQQLRDFGHGIPRAGAVSETRIFYSGLRESARPGTGKSAENRLETVYDRLKRKSSIQSGSTRTKVGA